MTVEQWRDAVFEAFPTQRYDTAFVGLTYYRPGDGGDVIAQYDATIFVRPTTAGRMGTPPPCAQVTGGADAAAPAERLALLRERVTALEAEWAAYEEARKP